MIFDMIWCCYFFVLSIVVFFCLFHFFIIMPLEDSYYQRRIDEVMERYLRSCAKSRSKDKEVNNDQQEEKE